MFQPQKSDYDLKFSVFDIPVRVHPWFWAMILFMGFQGRGPDLVANLISWGVAVFVSILAHELGHAMTGRMFGSHDVRIVLHGFGGVAIGASGRNRMEQIQVLAAGPAMGFILVTPFLIALIKTDVGLGWLSSLFPFLEDSLFNFVESTGGFVSSHRYMILFLLHMVVVNIVWGLINLLPVYPLDGGQIMNEVIGGNKAFGPSEKVNKISIVVALIVAAGLLSLGQPFAVFLFGYLAYINYQMMQRPKFY